MWMMPLHLHVNKKSDYDDMNIFIQSKWRYKGVKVANLGSKEHGRTLSRNFKSNIHHYRVSTNGFRKLLLR